MYKQFFLDKWKKDFRNVFLFFSLKELIEVFFIKFYAFYLIKIPFQIWTVSESLEVYERIKVPQKHSCPLQNNEWNIYDYQKQIDNGTWLGLLNYLNFKCEYKYYSFISEYNI